LFLNIGISLLTYVGLTGLVATLGLLSERFKSPRLNPPKDSQSKEIMQSFGDDTLFACIDIEKKHRILQEQTGDKIPLQEENSDLGKYFKSSSLLSEFTNTENYVDKSKLSDSGTKKIREENASDLMKYFEESILFPNVNSRRNLSSASSASKGNRLLRSQRNQSLHKTNKENVDINLKEKHFFDTANSTKKCDKYQGFKNKSPNNTQNATNSSNIRTLSTINATCDKENSEFVILSPPLCTQDRCKLASWGLPPNILEVLHYNMFNKCLYMHKVY